MTFCPPVFFSVSDVLSFILDKNNFYPTVKNAPVTNQRGWGNIFRSMIKGRCISGRRCTDGDEVRFDETKAAKGVSRRRWLKKEEMASKSAGIE
jgi:hypothetical protein